MLWDSRVTNSALLLRIGQAYFEASKGKMVFIRSWNKGTLQSRNNPSDIR
jgi:hypothetical protein